MPLQAQWEVGTHCVSVQWGGLGTNTFLQSQAQQCPSVRKCRKSAFRLPAERQLMQNMTI